MERHLNSGKHLTLHRRNRALVDGTTSRLRAATGAWVGSAFWSFGAFVLGSVLMYGLFGFSHGDQQLTAALLFLVGLVLLAGSIGGMVELVSLVRERRRHQHRGLLITGEVTKVEEVYVQTMVQTGFTAYAGHYEFRTFYRFLTPKGDERCGVVGLPKNRRPRPTPGDQLAILYAVRAKEQVL